MNLRFLNPIDLNGRISASSRIRIITPSNGMEKIGFDGGFNKSVNSDSIGVISKTSIQHWNPKCKKMIWDVCDNYFADRRRGQALQILKKCDAITTTTNKLKEQLQEIKIPNLRVKSQLIKHEYKNLLEFFHTIKNVGANTNQRKKYFDRNLYHICKSKKNYMVSWEIIILKNFI